MTKRGRKNRTLEQWQKRRSHHQIGKRLDSPSTVDREFMNGEIVQTTDKACRKYEVQELIGALLVLATTPYFVGAAVFALYIKACAIWVLMKEKLITAASLGTITFSEQPRTSYWELVFEYFVSHFWLTLSCASLWLLGVVLIRHGQGKEAIKEALDD
ncbi:hypothetical protein [Streptococcus suis]